MMMVLAVLVNLVLGTTALNIIRTKNSSVDLFEYEDMWCTGADAEDCDIKKNKRGSLMAQTNVRPFFVKFHKVGGTTLMELLNAFMGVSIDCGRSCGECPCAHGAKACTGHISKKVLVDYVVAAEHPSHNLLQAEEATLESRLIPSGDRRNLFAKLGDEQRKKIWVHHGDSNEKFSFKDAPLSWVPRKQDHEHVAFITLLRNPVERIRSKYYFRRAENFCGEGCWAKQMSFTKWMQSSGLEVCCEYVTTLGLGSVTRAKKVLATMFDVVGITEEMDHAFIDAARVFGVPESSLPAKITCRGNAESKQNWTSEELAIANKIAADDIEIYNFARALKQKRRENL